MLIKSNKVSNVLVVGCNEVANPKNEVQRRDSYRCNYLRNNLHCQLWTLNNVFAWSSNTHINFDIHSRVKNNTFPSGIKFDLVIVDYWRMPGEYYGMLQNSLVNMFASMTNFGKLTKDCKIILPTLDPTINIPTNFQMRDIQKWENIWYWATDSCCYRAEDLNMSHADHRKKFSEMTIIN